ncbi:MAG: glutamate-5-semialdehyde dehydrogenase [Acidimicrobiia bacterium]
MSVVDQLKNAKESEIIARSLTEETKNTLLNLIADEIYNNKDRILEVNAVEVENAKSNGLNESQIDRLILNQARIDAMIESARNVASLSEPVGAVLETIVRDSGITIEKISVPIGVVAVIYENRPNVTLDSACICLKSSNVCVLRGSSSALNTNRTIVECIHTALRKTELPESLVTFVEDESREGALKVMQARDYIDVLIPRGGSSLIESVQENAKVPTIIDGSGNCHVYVDKDADLDMAEKLVVNSKTQRTSVCNAAESLVVHTSVAREFVPRIIKALKNKDVDIVGDKNVIDIDSSVPEANEEDFGCEYLDKKISIAVVDSLDDAIKWINKYSSGHTESIITDNPESKNKFVNGILSAVVMHNTSTRFTDGERFGFGAEIGISTQRLHARGPMALRELTTYQYRVTSSGATVN